MTKHRCAGLLEQAEEPALSPACDSYWNGRVEVAAGCGKTTAGPLLPLVAECPEDVVLVLGFSVCRIIFFSAFLF